MSWRTANSAMRVGVKRRVLIINTVECKLLKDEIFETSYRFFLRFPALLGKVMPSIKFHCHSECTA